MAVNTVTMGMLVVVVEVFDGDVVVVDDVDTVFVVVVLSSIEIYKQIDVRTTDVFKKYLYYW